MTYGQGPPPPMPSEKRPKRFLHVSYTPSPSIDISVFEKLFGKAADWARYASNCWIIYTGIGADVWRDRIRKVSGMENANILIIELDPGPSAGYLPEWMWEWLNKPRDGHAGIPAPMPPMPKW